MTTWPGYDTTRWGPETCVLELVGPNGRPLVVPLETWIPLGDGTWHAYFPPPAGASLADWQSFTAYVAHVERLKPWGRRTVTRSRHYGANREAAMLAVAGPADGQ